MTFTPDEVVQILSGATGIATLLFLLVSMKLVRARKTLQALIVQSAQANQERDAMRGINEALTNGLKISWEGDGLRVDVIQDESDGPHEVAT